MKKLFIISLILSMLGCAVDKQISIRQDRKTKTLKMYVDPTVRHGGLGLLIVKPLGIYVSIPEPIRRLQLFDHDGLLLWDVAARDERFGGSGIQYGRPKKKEYTQRYPAEGEPQQLKRGEIYTLLMKTDRNEYIRRFVFQESELKITDNDILPQ